jgi:crotonobetainyl-CoA:carnitine CoA-transferase CaiB-like acyl-CoA transferase
MAESTGPLTRLRVVDLTWMLAGPYCTMLLADLGADVIKVEPPGGDPMRRVGPFRPDDQLRAFGGYFQSINRNKRSVVLDLKTESGADSLMEIAKSADVLVENFRAGVMERLGLAYERVRKHNPRLVYAAIRGFGDRRTGESPHIDRPAVDVTVQAMAGLTSITGCGPGAPLKAGPGVADIFPAALCAVGILAACRHADLTGEGQFLDVSMYDGVLSLCERIVYQYSYAGEVPLPQGNSHPFFCPFDIFPSADGHIAICASDDHQWAKLCDAMEKPELALDPRYRTGADRREHAGEVREIVAAWTSTRPNEDIVDAVAMDVPVGPVNTVERIFADPHARIREMLVDVQHPGCDRPVAIAGLPIKLSASPGGIQRGAPLLGEHTAEILAEVGAPRLGRKGESG